MNDASLRAIKPLCTNAEFGVLKTTVGTALKEQSPAALRRTLTKLRALRKKWRSQTITQRRRVRGARGGNAMLAAGRSEEKARAFADAIERVEGMIRRPGGAPTPSRRSKAKPAGRRASASGSTTRRGATAAPRRASASAAGSTSKRAPASASRRASTRATAPPFATPSADIRRAGEDASEEVTRTERIARKRGRGAIGAAQPAVAAADRTRHVREAGIDTRMLGHVSSQGRRNQARRDQRRAVALSAPRFARRAAASRAR